MSDTDISHSRFAWLRSGFDLEGYVGALAAILIGLLLSMFWGPLFLLGLVGAGIALLGTRTAERTPPLGDGLIVAPTDGIVVSVNTAEPPVELRLPSGEWTRVRVSVAPSHSNGVHAPMDGALGHIIRETGDPAAFAAMRAERPGLAVMFFTLASGEDTVGVRLATGGLGPRLEMELESEDAVRLGRIIGTLRLGGWCDVYIPSGLMVEPRVGQTLVGSETVLARWTGARAASPLDVVVETVTKDTSAPPTILPETSAEPEADAAPMVEVVTETQEADTPDADDALTLEKIAGAIKDAEPDPVDDEADEDVSEMFERLRREVRKNDTDD